MKTICDSKKGRYLSKAKSLSVRVIQTWGTKSKEERLENTQKKAPEENVKGLRPSSKGILERG